MLIYLFNLFVYYIIKYYKLNFIYLNKYTL